MCDFKPGDELIAVDDGGANLPGYSTPNLIVGQSYICSAITETVDACAACGSMLGVDVVEFPDTDCCYCPCSFRKVQKRNDRLTIEAFLTIKPGQFEEPRRPKAPAKKRERV